MAEQLTKGGIDWTGNLFRSLLLASLGFCVLVLAVADRRRGRHRRSRCSPVEPGDFLSGALRTQAAEAGLFQAIVGHVLDLRLRRGAGSFPLGVGAAAVPRGVRGGRRRFSRFVNVNIRNLAGVPSIVYGILGLTIFAKALEGITGRARGRTLISAGLTLAILVLPDRDHHRRGGGAGGAPRAARGRRTAWAPPAGRSSDPTCCPYAAARHHHRVRSCRSPGPSARPPPCSSCGAATGLLAGEPQPARPEPAPASGSPPCPSSSPSGPRTPSEGFDEIAAAAIIVMLVIVLVMNTVAILLRNRYEKKRT